MPLESYASDLFTFHADLRGFVATNGGRTSWLEQAPINIQQLCLSKFNELCVDVFDEMRRRHALAILLGLGNFDQLNALQPSASMHPRRNSARQKLSTLHNHSFDDLCIDVLLDLERRFPSLVELPLASPSDTDPPPRYTLVADYIPIALAASDNCI